ncbi:MAG: PaaI family thioesterase, partial [Bacteroidales bacterium]|nr:PaaI family thioesterase [Bacteroidales bacterium]
ATLLDEIASWTIQVKKGSSGVTGRMNVRYLKPVFINQPFILLMANIIFEKMNRVTVKADLFDHKEVLCTSAEVDYYVFPEDVARKKYNYPGYAKFFGD